MSDRDILWLVWLVSLAWVTFFMGRISSRRQVMKLVEEMEDRILAHFNCGN